MRPESLASLQQWLDVARSGSSTPTLLIEGEAGSGKTFLLDRLLEKSPDDLAAVTLSCQPNRPPSNDPLGKAAAIDDEFALVIAQLLALATERNIELSADVLDALTPHSHSNPASNNPESSNPESTKPEGSNPASSVPTSTGTTPTKSPLALGRLSQRPLHRAFLNVVNALTASGTLLLVIDNLQWMSDAGAQLLRELTTGGADGLAVLLSGRPGGNARVRATLNELSLWQRLEELSLGALSAQGSASVLVAAGVPTEQADHAAPSLALTTDGNPRLLQAAAEGFVPHPDNPAAALTEGIRLQFQALSPETRTTLTQAAVLGATTTVDNIRSALGSAHLDLSEALRAGWLTNLDAKPEHADRVGFTHDIYQTTSLDVAPAELAKCHANAAASLAPSPENDSARVLHLLAADVDLAEVHAIAARSGLAAMEQESYGAAAHLLGVALSGGGDPDPAKRHQLLVALAESQRRVHHPDVAASIKAAFNSSRELNDLDSMIKVALLRTKIGAFSSFGVIDEDLVQTLRFVLERVDPETRPGDAAMLLSALVEELLFGPEKKGRRAMAKRAIALAEQSGDPDTLFIARLAERNTLCRPDQLDERIKAGQRLSELTTAQSNAYGAASIHMMLSGNLLERGDRLGSELRLQLAEATNAELDSEELSYLLSSRRTAFLIMDGKFAEAEEAANADLQAGLAAGFDSTFAFGTYGTQMMMMRASQGRTDELVESFDLVYAERPTFPAFAAASALARAESGDDEGAEPFLEVIAADEFSTVAFDYFWVMTLALAGRAATVAGNGDYCAAIFERLAPYSGQLVWNGAAAMGPLDFHLGGCAAAMGDIDTARRLMHAALQQCTQLRMAPVHRHVEDSLAVLSKATFSPAQLRLTALPSH